MDHQQFDQSGVICLNIDRPGLNLCKNPSMKILNPNAMGYVSKFANNRQWFTSVVSIIAWVPLRKLHAQTARDSVDPLRGPQIPLFYVLRGCGTFAPAALRCFWLRLGQALGTCVQRNG